MLSVRFLPLSVSKRRIFLTNHTHYGMMTEIIFPEGRNLFCLDLLAESGKTQIEHGLMLGLSALPIKYWIPAGEVVLLERAP